MDIAIYTERIPLLILRSSRDNWFLKYEWEILPSTADKTVRAIKLILILPPWDEEAVDNCRWGGSVLSLVQFNFSKETDDLWMFELSSYWSNVQITEELWSLIGFVSYWSTSWVNQGNKRGDGGRARMTHSEQSSHLFYIEIEKMLPHFTRFAFHPFGMCFK